MRIAGVKIENWRNIRVLELGFDSRITVVHGPNEVGKSSVQEAIRNAFLLEASSAASELKELVPWGSEAKAHVELTFTTGAGEAMRIVKSFPKGEARLYAGAGGEGLFAEALLAEGRAVQPKLFELLGVPTEAADLFTLLWIGQGEGVELFARKRDESPLTGASQTLVKSIIKENLLSGRAEVFLRELKKERSEIFQKSGKPRKGSLLGDLEQRESELQREASALDGEVDEALRRAEELAAAEAEIAQVSARHEEEKGLLALLERKREAGRELEPKITALAEREQSRTRLLSFEEREKEAADGLPQLAAGKRRALEEWAKGGEERRAKAEGLRKRLTEVEGRLAGARVRERGAVEGLEEIAGSIREARIRLEASKLTVRARSSADEPTEVRISRDEGEEEAQAVGPPAEWSAMRSVRITLPGGLEIDCLGPLSREEWGRITSEIDGEERRLAGRLKELGCADIAEAKGALEEFLRLENERSRLDAELAALLGPKGDGLDRELLEVREAQGESAVEAKLLGTLGIELLGSTLPEAGEAQGGAREVGSPSERLRRLSNRVSVAIRDIEESRRECADILSGRSREEFMRELYSLKDEIAHERERLKGMEPAGSGEVGIGELEEKRRQIEQLAGDLDGLRERRTTLAALQARSGGLIERREALGRDLEGVQRDLEAERRRVGGIELLIELMESEKEELDRNIVAPLQRRLTEAFRTVAGERYSKIALNERLGIGEIVAPALRDTVEVDARALSYGAREQLSFLFRLLVAQYLSEREPQVMMLDDTFVNTDAERRGRLFEMMEEQEELQFILFTCHGDHYETYRGHDGVEIVDIASGAG